MEQLTFVSNGLLSPAMAFANTRRVPAGTTFWKLLSAPPGATADVSTDGGAPLTVELHGGRSGSEFSTIALNAAFGTYVIAVGGGIIEGQMRVTAKMPVSCGARTVTIASLATVGVGQAGAGQHTMWLLADAVGLTVQSPPGPFVLLAVPGFPIPVAGSGSPLVIDIDGLVYLYNSTGAAINAITIATWT